MLAFLAALVVLVVLVCDGRNAWAQARDGGAPIDAGARPIVDAGARPPSDAGAPLATPLDGGTDDAAAASDGGPMGAVPGVDQPQIRLPQTDAEKAEGLPIVALEIEGNRRISQDDVVLYIKERIGQSFHVESLATDVRSLWEAGFFEDIQVDLATTGRGIRLRFKVTERPNVKGIDFEGNNEIDTDKLLEAIEVKPNTILSIPAVKRSVTKIKDAYEEKGYFLADVEFTIDQQRDNEVIIRFKIAEHNPVTVRRVTFIGNEHIPDSDLKEVMQTGNGGFFAFGSGGPYRKDILERDLLLISSLYYDKGYMTVQIGIPRVMLTTDRDGIEITVLIHEGPRYKIRQLKIFEEDPSGNEIEPLGGRRALRELIRAHSGDFFNRAEVVKDLQAVRTLYRDAGFYTVEADPLTEVDPTKAEVDIIIPIHRGPPVRIERIEIKGNTKTRDSVFRREMEIQEGQLYSESGLEASKRRITALGYFERVDFTTEQGSAPDKVVVYFEVGERPTGTFQIGAGFSSIENFIATAQIQQANLFGNGQSLALQAQISSLRQIISLRFFEPYFFGTDWSTSAELYDQLYIYTDFARRSLGGSLTFGYALVQPWLRLSVTATAQHDKVDTSTTTFFGSTPTGVSGLFTRLPLANLFNAGRTISIRPAIVFDTRDNRLFPTSGVYLQASTELASDAFGSEVQFWRHRFTGRFYYPLFGNVPGQPGSGVVLKMNTEVGLITSPSTAGVPIYQRFFIGGILDVRGYRLRTIGPRLPLNQGLDPNAPPITNGANIGGNLQAYMNLELEFPILDKVGIRGVVFFDAGNAWNTEDQFCKTTPAPQLSKVVSPCFGPESLGYLRTSSGFGIRWFSPLGPLRFEWGFPLYRLPYEETYVFEFTIGNFF